MTLICMPHNNEGKFLEIAKKLEDTALVFLYDNVEQASKKPVSDNVTHGLLVKEKDKKKLMSLVNKARSKKIKSFVQATSEVKTNRFIIEALTPDVLFDLEALPRKDSMHYKRSGLDQVLCKLLAKKGVAVGISFSSILESKEPQRVIGRILQNIKFCKKYKVKMFFSSFSKNPYHLRSTQDMKAFLRSLGVDAGVVKKMF